MSPNGLWGTWGGFGKGTQLRNRGLSRISEFENYLASTERTRNEGIVVSVS